MIRWPRHGDLRLTAMTQSANRLRTFPGNSRLRLNPKIYINASRGEESSGKNNSAKHRSLRKFRSAKDEQIKQGKELYEQKRLNRC